MQFIKNGPDIPDRLLQAHEEGRVVFFCGAGISSAAGLPGFAGLVDELYEELGYSPTLDQRAAIEAKQFDTAIGLLEADIQVGREGVRRALAKVLATDNVKEGTATATHEALLTLAKDRKDQTRLITTNFDRLFEKVKCAELPSFKAPLLPVPKKSTWNGLVYLHGLLPVESAEGASQSELEQLVVSSGDFGLAYLAERWAARFVSELFRNFTVCFVGYSIGDPVMRYMLDALAADRLRGETSLKVFAFGSCSKGKEAETANAWKLKNVIPILYEEFDEYLYLHKTLQTWSEAYRDGVQGKEQIVIKYAGLHPKHSTTQDDFVGRILWALSDPSGFPAQRFAEFNPTPHFDWLELLMEKRYRHTDLGRFGVPPQSTKDDGLSYSLISRPAPYSRAPWMAIADSGPAHSNWDDVISHLARWLLRHLGDPRLVHWVIKNGGQLHEQMRWLIERRLNEIYKLSSEGNAAELGRIRENAPNAIPSSEMRILWGLILSGRVQSKPRHLDLFLWYDQFKRDGLTVSVRFALREILKPCVSLSGPIGFSKEDDTEDLRTRIRRIAGWEIVLASDFAHSALEDLHKDKQWQSALPELIYDFSALLRDVFNLMHALGVPSGESDISRPSIADHPNNESCPDWMVLIDLTRDAWLATAVKSIEKARSVAETWAHEPYPVFRRLAFFAAAQDGIIPTQQAVDWLLADNQRWLWSDDMGCEAINLLASLTPRLDLGMQEELERVILLGPPRSLYGEADIDPDIWDHIVKREVWLRLSKLSESGAVVSEAGKAWLGAFSAEEAGLSTLSESDEFSDGNDGIRIGHRGAQALIPDTSQGIQSYLLAHPAFTASQREAWRKCCRERAQESIDALCALGGENQWLVDAWRVAFQDWEIGGPVKGSWQYMAPLIASAPDDWIQALAREVSGWLRAVPKPLNIHEGHFIKLSRRILDLDFDNKFPIENPVTQAINHPVGLVSESLLGWLFSQKPNDGQGLPQPIKPIFTQICDTQVEKFRHGRVLLSAHAVSLFRVDEKWFEQYLLPLFDWKTSEFEAQAAWKGFLWSPRLYDPLMEVMKPAFLDTAKHYEQLGDHGRQFADLLTLAALESRDVFTTAELRGAMGKLPVKGLNASLRMLAKTLGGAGSQRKNYWENRFLPFWNKIWPKTKLDLDAEAVALLCIAAGEEFPSAVKTLRSWLNKISDPFHVLGRLEKSGLCKKCPSDALRLLSKIVGDDLPFWAAQPLRKCLNDISEADETQMSDGEFKRLALACKFGA